MDDNKLEAKLLKIKALAERGEGGEKEAAIKMYHKLLKKYDIDEKALQKTSSASTGLHMRQISRKIFWSRFFTW
ncbi:hypothetical protein COPCOM_01904 [Coprococcus comes ATCC 27758]|uniref:DUF2786 domain-containing protein n=1 Tax=Coprococcus comes ATCC 27758 TaxID=470146 RepID=C0B9S7_9FIRM|nr:hypothetical protein COPCOM_01904 [Coprococcus comes ATCC 27758]